MISGKVFILNYGLKNIIDGSYFKPINKKTLEKI